MEPSDANAETPTFSFIDQSRIAVHKAPDWLINATDPGFARFAAKVAFNPFRGFMKPRQLGPRIRIPVRVAMSITCFSNAMPGGPSSLNPAEITIAAGTPASAHSWISPGT